MWKDEKFSRGQAWIDLLMLANHKDSYVRKRGIKIDVLRGQVGWSERQLAERWQWSRGKVRRFLDELENDLQISQQNGPQNINVTSLITIVNYEKYQTIEPQNGPQTDHKRTTNSTMNKNDKNDKNVKKESKRFMEPTVFEVKRYMDEIEYKGNPQKFVDHYASKGWMIGKNKMKDWKAAVRTWRNNDNDKSGITGSTAQAGTKTSRSENKPSIVPGIGVKDFACGFPDRSGEW